MCKQNCQVECSENQSNNLKVAVMDLELNTIFPLHTYYIHMSQGYPALTVSMNFSELGKLVIGKLLDS